MLTNEIESQCPQMLALFEGSQKYTDEEISQLILDKSEDISDNAPMISLKEDKGKLFIINNGLEVPINIKENEDDSKISIRMK